MSCEYKGTDKRKHKRLSVNFLVVYALDTPLELIMTIKGQIKTALMADLGESGMAILTNQNIPKSTILAIKFTLVNIRENDAERITSMEIIGEVRYNELTKDGVHRLGVKFKKIKKEDKRAIANFVKMARE